MAKLTLLLILAAAIALAQPEKLPGTWVRTVGGQTYTLELQTNGSGTLNGAPLQWRLAQGILTFDVGTGRPHVASAAVTDTMLTLTPANGPAIVFNRAGASPPATKPAAKPTAEAQGCHGLVGSWRSPDAVITLTAEGTTVIAGVSYRYTSDGKIITLTGADGVFRFPYTLDGQRLTVTMNGTPVTLECLVDNAPGGSTPQDLAGKWCYLSNFSANSGGRISSQCIVLRANGTYEYAADTSSSGPVASSATQERDSGTWTATGNTLTAHSATRGTTTVYTLEKRNHPKNRDPMIVLNGKAFVTYGPRAPW
jgi:hypothetical protein